MRILCAVALAAVASAANAELVLGFGAGAAHTADSDVLLSEPPATSLHLDGISWTDESFADPPYYTVRIAYWLERSPRWGTGFEFTHAKAIARRERAVSVTGVRDGVAVSGSEPLGETFSDLELSHGLNLLLVDGLYRWRAAPARAARARRITSWVGLAAGAAIPHVEVTTAQSATSEYQVAGPAAQALLGVGLPIARRWSLIGEYRLSWADLDLELEGGGSLGVRPLTHHLVIGAELRLGTIH